MIEKLTRFKEQEERINESLQNIMSKHVIQTKSQSSQIGELTAAKTELMKSVLGEIDVIRCENLDFLKAISDGFCSMKNSLESTFLDMDR